MARLARLPRRQRSPCLVAAAPQASGRCVAPPRGRSGSTPACSSNCCGAPCPGRGGDMPQAPVASAQGTLRVHPAAWINWGQALAWLLPWGRRHGIHGAPAASRQSVMPIGGTRCSPFLPSSRVRARAASMGKPVQMKGPVRDSRMRQRACSAHCLGPRAAAPMRGRAAGRPGRREVGAQPGEPPAFYQGSMGPVCTSHSLTIPRPRLGATQARTSWPTHSAHRRGRPRTIVVLCIFVRP
jgi:hypothetical protein